MNVCGCVSIKFHFRIRKKKNLIPSEGERKGKLGGRGICLGHETKTETVLGTPGRLVVPDRGVLDCQAV